jgi:hypothetical protein
VKIVELFQSRTECHGIEICSLCLTDIGARGSVVVKAPCYKLEGRGFETR